MKKNNNVKSLDTFIDEQFGASGTSTRVRFESNYANFKIGYLIQHARMELGLTQEELATRCGTNKGYISKIENDVKEVRLSTLHKIVEKGLGGRIDLKIIL